MTEVTIYLAPLAVKFQFLPEASVVRENLALYTNICTFETNLNDADSLEEVFDLTNNPDRYDERERVCGRNRTPGVGDIFSVNGVKYLCKSTGWERI